MYEERLLIQLVKLISHSNEAEYQCYKNNKVFTSTQSIFPTSFEQSSSIILPQNMGKAEIRWMDGAEKNGLINVQYF